MRLPTRKDKISYLLVCANLELDELTGKQDYRNPGKLKP